MKVWLAISCICLSGEAHQSHQQGLAYAQELHNKKKTVSQTTNPHIVPGYQTDSPPQASLDAGTLGDAVVREASSNPISHYIKETAQTRASYRLDPNSNPLFTDAEEVHKDPEKVLQEEFRHDPDPSVNDEANLKTCIEGGDEYKQTCQRYLDITLQITPAYVEQVPHCRGHWSNKAKTRKRYCNPGCEMRNGRTIPKSVTVEKEEWVDTCQPLEKLADAGVCRYAEKIESPKNEIRTIQGEPVTRDHFEETLIYACTKPVENTCAALKASGCQQIKSECHEREAGRCVAWQQTYRCGSKMQRGNRYRATSNNSPFCLTGNCVNASYEANEEILDSMTQLQVLKEIQNELRKGQETEEAAKEYDINKLGIFKGEARKCSKSCVNFKDCCGTLKGWGTDVGLASCSGKEKELAELRKQNLCVQVGTYCAEKKAGVCLRKKTSFCCFGTKLFRLIQEQGRHQLKLSWGDSKTPDCRGLKPVELSRLKFAEMNFNEIYEDVKKNFKEKAPAEMTTTITLDRVKENMNLKTGGPTS
ncbi:conjugal transfer protein TraN [Candidatus Odyssella thessalonicensis]|uniref:conjugal transfer protein TraN n=1 Tax=Candidatus Odyssella thessalonicensis TaxID=84647 RepID=UPI000225ACE9|nr:conjugal transfer protein TraN [Candidatus Odyssella thessalonicensis]